MRYIRITKENIDFEHICCAMSGKQSVAKKAWLRERFAEGLVFYRSEERGKCFIEYIPAENAWVPIDAPGYLYIDCLWVSGALKGHGYAGELLAEPIPRGVSYNAYLLLDKKSVLFDTVDWSACRQLLENLDHLLGDRELRMEYHRGILAYGTEEIHISGGKLVVRVRGTGLELRSMNPAELLITGQILSLDFT